MGLKRNVQHKNSGRLKSHNIKLYLHVPYSIHPSLSQKNCSLPFPDTSCSFHDLPYITFHVFKSKKSSAICSSLVHLPCCVFSTTSIIPLRIGTASSMILQGNPWGIVVPARQVCMYIHGSASKYSIHTAHTINISGKEGKECRKERENERIDERVSKQTNETKQTNQIQTNQTKDLKSTRKLGPKEGNHNKESLLRRSCFLNGTFDPSRSMAPAVHQRLGGKPMPADSPQTFFVGQGD